MRVFLRCRRRALLATVPVHGVVHHQIETHQRQNAWKQTDDDDCQIMTDGQIRNKSVTQHNILW